MQADETLLPETCYEVPFVFVKDKYFGGVDEIPPGLLSGNLQRKMDEKPNLQMPKGLEKSSDAT